MCFKIWRRHAAFPTGFTLILPRPVARRSAIRLIVEHNPSNMRRIFGGDPDGKIHRLLDFSSSPRDISDPWYTGDFEATYADVLEGCEALLNQLAASLR